MRVDLDVAEGEFVSIIGPNGAGKTTLFNLVTGLDERRCRHGDVSRAATSPACRRSSSPRSASRARSSTAACSEPHRARQRAGRRAHAASARCGRHGLAARCSGRSPSSRSRWCGPARSKAEEGALREEALEILARFGDRLLPRIDHPAYSLSYANRRRVEIARALALGPRLLLLDEPTAGMNQTETAEMQALIGELKSAGLTILLIEHKLDMVMQLSDRVVVMDEGRRSPKASRPRCATIPAVIEAYLGHRRAEAARRSRRRPRA